MRYPGAPYPCCLENHRPVPHQESASLCDNGEQKEHRACGGEEERGMSKALTYSSYLRLDELLNLQTPRSVGPHGPEHDELLFIVIHQVYELWFKEILHEIDHLQDLLHRGDAARAAHTMRRILAILKTVVAQIDVMETMTPLEFNAFRGFLESASGFQSAQFREIEFA